MISTGTTWGLSGPTFLWLYAGLAVVVAVAIRWQWQRALGTTPRTESAELDPYRLAMLNGGPQLAITAAVAKLHDIGTLRSDAETRRPVVAQPPRGNADPLERAVVEAVERDPRITISALRRALAESEPVAALEGKLTSVGLLMEPAVRARLRLLRLAAVAVVVAGIARIWA
ncbi:MAG: hypothetical protein QOG42_2012, partial [Solirubrobacteraceae bacterium]|nr:hypothetical protein [Solirubrobacteraceae bacterium]